MTADYFQEIESHFARRRGTAFVFNAKDWSLMKGWADEGIPLSVVIEAIDSVFDKNEARGSKRVVSSLSYCRHAVKEIWSERRELHVGGEDSSPEENGGVRLEQLASALESADDASVRAFGQRVRALSAEKSVPRIEEALIALEEELIDAVLKGSGSDLREEAAKIDLSGLDPKVRERTIEANLRRLARDRFSIPRLTLF